MRAAGHSVSVVTAPTLKPLDRDGLAEVLRRLDEAGKDVVVVANKIDKVKRSARVVQLAAIQAAVGAAHKVIPYSAVEKIGVGELVNEISLW